MEKRDPSTTNELRLTALIPSPKFQPSVYLDLSHKYTEQGKILLVGVEDVALIWTSRVEETRRNVQG